MNNGFKFQSNHRKNVLVITLTKNKITYRTVQNIDISDDDFLKVLYDMEKRLNTMLGIKTK